MLTSALPKDKESYESNASHVEKRSFFSRTWAALVEGPTSMCHFTGLFEYPLKDAYDKPDRFLISLPYIPVLLTLPLLQGKVHHQMPDLHQQ